MDIVSILFLVFGWIFRVKGLVITALVITSISMILELLIMSFTESTPEKLFKSKIAIIIDCTLLAFAIIRLCIM